MKISLKHFLPLFLLTVALVGCAGTSATSQETGNAEPSAAAVSSERADGAASSDDHHAGETNVAPHDDSQTSSASSDHHEGETNVKPHDDSASSHDDSNQPPHRD